MLVNQPLLILSLKKNECSLRIDLGQQGTIFIDFNYRDIPLVLMIQQVLGERKS